MTRKTVLAALAIICGSSIYAQDAPQKNNITAAITIGCDYYTTAHASTCYSSNGFTAESTNWQDRKVMTGIELGWFASPKTKLSLGGGFNYSCTPGFYETRYTHGCSNSYCESYSYQNGTKTICYATSLAGIYYIDTHFDRLKITAGLRGTFAHSIDKLKPKVPSNGTSSVNSNTTLNHLNHYTTGKAEAINIKGAAIVGAEYFVARGFFAGIEVDLGSFTYSMAKTLPSDSHLSIKGTNYNCSFLSAPTMKMGFVF